MADRAGYGRPPKSGQFKKGRSGNPRGRPKGSASFVTVLTRAAREKVPVVENGKRKLISKGAAAAKQVANKAASGDAKASQFLLTTLLKSDAAVEPAKPDRLNDADEATLKGLIERIRAYEPDA